MGTLSGPFVETTLDVVRAANLQADRVRLGIRAATRRADVLRGANGIASAATVVWSVITRWQKRRSKLPRGRSLRG